MDNDNAPLTLDELNAFKRSYFYKYWKDQFNRLGEVGLIAIPNTTDQEWLAYFKEWSKLFSDDYQTFKNMVNEALQNNAVDLSKIQTQLDELNTIIKNIQSYYCVNVRWYGAVGDGKTDDSDAIKKAINEANNGSLKCLFFPAGTYLTTFTNISLGGILIKGAGRMKTTIVNDQSDPTFVLDSDVTIRDIGFHTNVSTFTTMFGIKKNSPDDVAHWNITLDNLRFDSIEYPDPTHQKVGYWGFQPIYFDLNNIGLWDVTIRNISMQYVYGGLTFDSRNGGWLTGSLFDNIVVKGFDHHAVAIISSNNTLKQVTQCVFSNLTAQVLYEVHGNDSAGFIVAGGPNEWDNLRLFKDGTYNLAAIMLRYFGQHEELRKFPSYAEGTTTTNHFVGGMIEGNIVDPDNIKDFQTFDKLNVVIPSSTGNLQAVSVATEKTVNLLSKKGFMFNIIGDIQKGLPNATLSTGIDEHGTYLDIKMSSTPGAFQYILTDPTTTLSAIKDGDFSIGIKFKDLSDTKNASLDAYPTFNSTDYSPNRLRFDNLKKYTNLQEWVWACDSISDKLNAITNVVGNNRINIYLNQNNYIRLYDVALVKGKTTSWDNILPQNETNNGNAGAIPLLDAGLSLNVISSNMIRYSGTFNIETNNRLSDTPAEFLNFPYILTVIPGENNANGIIKLFSPKLNLLMMTGVYNGAAGGWIKLTA